MPQTD